MKLRMLLAIAAAGLASSGCQSDAQVLANETAVAQETAQRRGRFELNCPAASATVLSSNMLQPVYWRGIERAEYTVGVEGCGQRKTYIVVCQVGSPSCVAASAR